MTDGRASTQPVHRHPAYRAVVGALGAHTAIAFSGGPDSTALVILAAEAARRGAIQPCVAIHVDHLTRPESGVEAQAAADASRQLGMPFVRVTIAEPVNRFRRSPEDRLRELRYEALARVGSALGVTSVATAHTFDDQVETILFRLFSGSGGVASAGIQPQTVLRTAAGPITILRPLIGIRRADLVEIVRQVGMPTIVDPSNADLAFRRNRLRLNVMPEIASTFPGYEAALVRSVELSARDAHYVDREAERLCPDVVLDASDRVVLDRRAVASMHPAIASRILRSSALRLVDGDAREMTFERVESLRRALSGRTGAIIQLPYCLAAEIGRDEVTIKRVKVDTQDA